MKRKIPASAIAVTVVVTLILTALLIHLQIQSHNNHSLMVYFKPFTG